MEPSHQRQKTSRAEVEKKVTPEVVEALVEGFLKKNFDQPADIPDFHREMWGFCCSDYKFVALAAPRGFAKSTAITHAYTLACVLFRERKFVLIVADTETQAALFLDDIKKELLTNEDLIKVFGIKGLIKSNETDIIVEFEDGAQARLMAKGSGQSLRGIKWDGKRPDLIVCDDLENEEMMLNKDRRANFRRWFSGTLLPCRSKDGIIRVVGTILHTDSQLNRLMPKLGKRDRPVFIDDLREISNPKDVWRSARYRAHDRKMLISLWPENKSIEWLMNERQTFIDAGETDLWAQEMLNVPFDETMAPFRRRDFIEMETPEYEQNLNYYVSCDFATSEKQRTDYTVFLVAAVNQEGQLYVINVVHERMEVPEILETWFQLMHQYDPQSFFVEKGQIWNMLQPLITNEMYKTGQFVLIEEMASSMHKLARSSAIRGRMRTGAVKFDKQKPWWPDFEEECLRFTGSGSTHDDQVDALSLLGLALNKFVEAPSAQEEQEEQYQEELESSGFYQQGRSEYTGY